jgi:hypothetical protein
VEGLKVPGGQGVGGFAGVLGGQKWPGGHGRGTPPAQLRGGGQGVQVSLLILLFPLSARYSTPPGAVARPRVGLGL